MASIELNHTTSPTFPRVLARAGLALTALASVLALIGSGWAILQYGQPFAPAPLEVLALVALPGGLGWLIILVSLRYEWDARAWLWLVASFPSCIVLVTGMQLTVGLGAGRLVGAVLLIVLGLICYQAISLGVRDAARSRS